MRYFHSPEAKEFVGVRSQHLSRDCSNSSYCHSVSSFLPVCFPHDRFLDARYLNQSRSSSRSDEVAFVSQIGCYGQTGFGTYASITRPREDRYSTAAMSMPPRGRRLSPTISNSNKDETETSTYLDFHIRYFCCKPSTEKQMRREYDPLAGFLPSKTVLRRVV